ncbi:MAG: chloride channel protein [Janthinobacterium lividum]
MDPTAFPGAGLPVAPALQPVLAAEHLVPKPPRSPRRLLRVAGLAVGIGAVISVVAKGLVYLINLVTNLAFYGAWSVAYHGPAGNHLGAFVVVLPALGGLVVGLMALYGTKAIRGHGIPEAMEQVLTNQSRIKPVVMLMKPLSAAISIGTGGPFGAEGPIIATGGALGSTVGQLLAVTPAERKVLLAAGATAGMSAIFGTPIAAIFLAIELLLFEFSPRAILPVALACITGAAGHHWLFEAGPVFPMAALAAPSNPALATYSFIGVVIGLLSVGVTKAVYWVEDVFEKLPIHWAWWPALGGLAVGGVGYFAPRTLGVGYENLTDLLAGSLPLQAVASLCLLKFVSWAVSLGSGTSGGTLAPLLTIGGAAGALLGLGLHQFFPQTDVVVPLAALVGMAAMFAGAARALLTAIVFAVEATGQAPALLPLLGACTAAYLVSFVLMENTIMTEKIARRGVKTPDSYEPDPLEKIRVAEVLPANQHLLSADLTVAEARQQLGPVPAAATVAVVAPDGQVLGLLTAAALHHPAQAATARLGALAQPAPASVHAADTLRTAVNTMARAGVEALPVLGPGRAVAGVLVYADVLRAYKLHLVEGETAEASLSVRRGGLQALHRGRRLLRRGPRR